VLVHSVYFYLKPELSPAQQEAFFQGLESLCAVSHAEAVYIGRPAPLPERPVLDKSYSFALTVLFSDLAAHDRYQVDPLHKAFLEQFRSFWARVQVYDSQ
jgi:hypothetical protein